MRKILFTLCVLFANSAHAEGTLRPGSLICTTKADMAEARSAAAHGDEQWFNSIRGCGVVSTPLKARRVECDGAYCLVRAFSKGGRSVLVYAERDVAP